MVFHTGSWGLPMGLIPISHFPTPSFPLPNKPLVLKVLSLSHLLEAPNQDTGNVRGSTVWSGLPSEPLHRGHLGTAHPAPGTYFFCGSHTSQETHRLCPGWKKCLLNPGWCQHSRPGDPKGIPDPPFSPPAPSMLPRVPTRASRICPPPPLCSWHKYSLPTTD